MNAENSTETLKSGYLMKRSRLIKQWRKRYFILRADALTSHKDCVNPGKPTEVIVLKDVRTVKAHEDFPKKNCLMIQTTERNFYIVAASRTEREQWLGAISKAITKPTALTESIASN